MTTKMDISPSAFAPAGEESLVVGTPADKPSPALTHAVFRCTFPGCGREFMLKGNLKRHQNIHSGDRKFACKQCDRAFFRKADLEVHYRVHTGEKPYTCKHQHCDKRFARRSDLLSHERTHLYVALARVFSIRLIPCSYVLCVCVCSGEKPFACTFPGCDRRFARRFDLHKHQRMHGDSADSEPAKSDPNTSDSQELVDSLTIWTGPPLDSVTNKPYATSYGMPCTEDHIHSPPSCFASLPNAENLEAFLATAQMPFEASKLRFDTDLIVERQPRFPAQPMQQMPVAAGALLSEQPPAAAKKEEKESESALCAKKLLHNYSAHNPSCGHLSIQHGNHRDYVVKNHLVCQDSVKQIGEKKKCTTEDAHRPGCGHLAVRHKDHIDYVVEDSLFCQHAGLLGEADNIELLDDDFWEFYGAVGSLNNDDL